MESGHRYEPFPEDDVKAAKEAISDVAMRGKLATQWAIDCMEEDSSSFRDEDGNVQVAELVGFAIINYQVFTNLAEGLVEWTDEYVSPRTILELVAPLTVEPADTWGRP